jgi:hypothetical protein
VKGIDCLGDLVVDGATAFSELKADMCFGLIQRHAVKTYGEVEMCLDVSLTSVHVGVSCYCYAPTALPPGGVAC